MLWIAWSDFVGGEAWRGGNFEKSQPGARRLRGRYTAGEDQEAYAREHDDSADHDLTTRSWICMTTLRADSTAPACQAM